MSAVTSVYQELRLAVDNSLQKVEQGLDVAGYFPIISTISGGIRIDYGLCEIIVGVALAVLGAAATFFLRDDRLFWWGAELVVHGFANIARGAIECQKWINLICYVTDRFAHAQNSDLRLRYDTPLWKTYER